jgi:DNA polymerase I-like protein with 3'-5' exonuclease and polymerase domains
LAVADDLSADLKEIMENIYKLPVKLTVDVDSGKNWGEL